MGFEDWNEEHWKVTQYEGYNGVRFELHAPSVNYVFNKQDFLEFVRRINTVAENIYEKETWFVHDGTIINRETGEQLIGVMDDCYKINELTEKIQEIENYKEHVTRVMLDEFESESNNVWSETYIRNLARKLKVDLK